MKWLYSGKSGCFWSNVVVFGKKVVLGQKVLYSGRMVSYGK